MSVEIPFESDEQLEDAEFQEVIIGVVELLKSKMDRLVELRLSKKSINKDAVESDDEPDTLLSDFNLEKEKNSEGCPENEKEENMASDFNKNAGWEQRDERAICRWFICWKEITATEWAGALAGYSGGGSFQGEIFYAKFIDSELVSLMIDLEDKVTNEEIDFFDDVPAEIISEADDAMDEIWEWNDQDEWEEREQALLLEDKKDLLEKDGDMLYLRGPKAEIVHKICELAGLTAGPLK